MADEFFESNNLTEFEQAEFDRCVEAIGEVVDELVHEVDDGVIVFSAMGCVLTALFLHLEPIYMRRAIAEFIANLHHNIEAQMARRTGRVAEQ